MERFQSKSRNQSDTSGVSRQATHGCGSREADSDPYCPHVRREGSADGAKRVCIPEVCWLGELGSLWVLPAVAFPCTDPPPDPPPHGSGLRQPIDGFGPCFFSA